MCPNTRNQFPTAEIRPRMLKDYLMEDLNSCSSSGFKLFPRKPPLSDYAARRRRSTPVDVARPNNGPRKLLIRRPSKAASTSISAFRAMINAVKNIQFVKSPSVILPRARSLSRSLSRRSSTKNKNREQNPNVRQVKITVKDIMRWTSFRDINVEQHPQLFDIASTSDHHCTATTTTTTSSCTYSSSGSSWCDSDFTAEDLPSWSSNCEEDDGEIETDVVDKKNLPAFHKEYCEDVTAGYTVEPKVEAQCEEERHEQSPITVLHREFEEDEESLSSVDQSLVNFERTKEKFMQNIRRLENLGANEEEERYSNLVEDQQEEFIRDEEIEENNAWQLLEQVKTTSSLDTVEQLVLFDFFRDELGGHPGFETEMVIRKAKAWVRGEHSTLFELGADDDEDKREAFVNDLYMEGRGRWSGEFEEEQNELAMEVENDLLCDLVDQLLFDILL